jgi:hypothetical protein
MLLIAVVVALEYNIQIQPLLPDSAISSLSIPHSHPHKGLYSDLAIEGDGWSSSVNSTTAALVSTIRRTVTEQEIRYSVNSRCYDSPRFPPLLYMSYPFFDLCLSLVVLASSIHVSKILDELYVSSSI